MKIKKEQIDYKKYCELEKMFTRITKMKDNKKETYVLLSDKVLKIIGFTDKEIKQMHKKARVVATMTTCDEVQEISAKDIDNIYDELEKGKPLHKIIDDKKSS